MGSRPTDATARAAPGVASVYARYADARTSASAIVAARWPGGSMRTSFADETTRIQTRDADAVNAAPVRALCSVRKIEVLPIGLDTYPLEPVWAEFVDPLAGALQRGDRLAPSLDDDAALRADLAIGSPFADTAIDGVGDRCLGEAQPRSTAAREGHAPPVATLGGGRWYSAGPTRAVRSNRACRSGIGDSHAPGRRSWTRRPRPSCHPCGRRTRRFPRRCRTRPVRCVRGLRRRGRHPAIIAAAITAIQHFTLETIDRISRQDSSIFTATAVSKADVSMYANRQLRGRVRSTEDEKTKSNRGGPNAEGHRRGSCRTVVAVARRSSGTSVPAEAHQVRHSCLARVGHRRSLRASSAKTWSRRSASRIIVVQKPRRRRRAGCRRVKRVAPGRHTRCCSAPTARLAVAPNMQ